MLGSSGVQNSPLSVQISHDAHMTHSDCIRECCHAFIIYHVQWATFLNEKYYRVYVFIVCRMVKRCTSTFIDSINRGAMFDQNFQTLQMASFCNLMHQSYIIFEGIFARLTLINCAIINSFLNRNSCHMNNNYDIKKFYKICYLNVNSPVCLCKSNEHIQTLKERLTISNN